MEFFFSLLRKRAIKYVPTYFDAYKPAKFQPSGGIFKICELFVIQQYNSLRSSAGTGGSRIVECFWKMRIIINSMWPLQWEIVIDILSDARGECHSVLFVRIHSQERKHPICPSRFSAVSFCVGFIFFFLKGSQIWNTASYCRWNPQSPTVNHASCMHATFDL